MKKLIDKGKVHTHRLLRKSEKYFKTDMIYLARGSFWLTLGQAVSSGSALLLAIAFANYVTPEVYGTYKYTLSIAGLFAIFSLPGMSTALTRAVARGHEGVIHKTTQVRFKYSLAGTLVALLGASYYFWNDNTELTLALLIIAVSLPLVDTFTAYMSYLVGKRRFDLQTKYHVVTQITSAISLITTIYFTNNLHFILLAYFIPIILTRFVLYWYVTQTITHTVDETEQKEVLAYGKHLTVIAILSTIAGQLDKILIWKFLGPAQVAIYTFALAIPDQIKGPLKYLDEMMQARFVSRKTAHIHIGMHNKMLWLLVSSIIIVTSYIFVAPYIFSYLFPAYIDAVTYSQIYALSLFSMIVGPAASYLSAKKKIMHLYINTVIGSLLQIALLILGVILWGLWGIVFARVLTRIIGAFFIILPLYYSAILNDRGASDVTLH